MHSKNYLFAISLVFSVIITTNNNNKHEDYFLIRCLSACKLCSQRLKSTPMVAFFEKVELDKILEKLKPLIPFVYAENLKNDINYASNSTIGLTTKKSCDNTKRATDNAIFDKNNGPPDSVNNHAEFSQSADVLKKFIDSETFKSKLSSCEMKKFQNFCLENTLFPEGYEVLFRALFHEICFFKIRNRFFKNGKIPLNIWSEILKSEDLSKILLKYPENEEKHEEIIKYLIKYDSKEFLSKFKNTTTLNSTTLELLIKIFCREGNEVHIPGNNNEYRFFPKKVADIVIVVLLKIHETIINSGIQLDFKDDLLNLVSREREKRAFYHLNKDILANIIHSLLYGTTESLKRWLKNLFGKQSHMKKIPIAVLISEFFFEKAKSFTKEQEQAKESPFQNLLIILGGSSFFSIIIENSELNSDMKFVLKAFYDEEVNKKCLNSVENFIQNYYFLPLSLSEKIIVLNYLKELNKGLVLDAKYFFKKSGKNSPLKYLNHETLYFLITEVGFITFLSRARCSNIKTHYNDDNETLIIREMQNDQLLNTQFESFEEGCIDIFIPQATKFSNFIKNKSISTEFIQMIEKKESDSKEIRAIKSPHSSSPGNDYVFGCSIPFPDFLKNEKTILLAFQTINFENLSPERKLKNLFSQIEKFISSKPIETLYFMLKNHQFQLFQYASFYYKNRNYFSKNYYKLYSLDFNALDSYQIPISSYFDFWIEYIFSKQEFISDFEMVYFARNVIFLFRNKYFHEKSSKIKECLCFHRIDILEELSKKIGDYLQSESLKIYTAVYGAEIKYSLKAFNKTVVSVIEDLSASAAKFSDLPIKKRRLAFESFKNLTFPAKEFSRILRNKKTSTNKSNKNGNKEPVSKKRKKMPLKP